MTVAAASRQPSAAPPACSTLFTTAQASPEPGRLRSGCIGSVYGQPERDNQQMTAEQQEHEPASQAPDRNLALELARVTEAASLASARWVGRGDKNGADGA